MYRMSFAHALVATLRGEAVLYNIWSSYTRFTGRTELKFPRLGWPMNIAACTNALAAVHHETSVCGAAIHGQENSLYRIL